MVRKIIFVVFILCAAGFGAWGYLQLKNNKKPKVDALRLIPEHCMLYASTGNFFEFNKKLNSQSLIADKLRLFDEPAQFCAVLNRFDSLFNNQALLKEEVLHNPIHFAVYPEQLDWLVTFNIRQLGEQEKVNTQIAALLKAKVLKNEVYTFSQANNKNLFYAMQAGVVVISSAETLILSALSGTAKKLFQQPAFIEFKNTLEENKLLSVYIDHQLYQASRAVKKLRLPLICENGFSAGAVDIQPSELKINGFLHADSAGMASAFSGQVAQTVDFIAALPFTTNYFQAYGFNSFAGVKARLNNKTAGAQQDFWTAVNDSALYNVETGFFSNIIHQVVDFESGAAKQKHVLLAVNDSLLAHEHLRLMSDSVFVLTGDSVFRIGRSAAGAPGKLLSPLSACMTRYAAIFNSAIYFSESTEDMGQLLYHLKNNLLMTENESFMAYQAQNFPETYNYLSYSSPNLDKERRNSFFNFETQAKTDPFENFRHFSFSVTNNKSKLEFRWHLLNETEAVNKEQNILWALQLDTVAANPAYHFVNHLSRENEVLVQDDARRLYLINAKGTVLWKKQIKEMMTSAVFVVDVFKNNKHQMLFSSKNQLHLIDRNGNYLPGYPVNLPAESTAPLSVFDYDNARDYRLLIPCRNKQIYNYLISGKRHEKFQTFRSENLVRLPVQYIKVGLSDYLVALDEEGKIYTFSRRGEARIGLKNKATANCSAFYMDVTANVNSTLLVYADDKNSLINKVSLADKKDIVKLNYGVENAGVNFCPTVDRKSANIIFTKLNAVIVYDLNGNLLQSRSFDNDLKQTDFYADDNRNFYLSWSEIRGELLLVEPSKARTKSFSATALPLVTDLFKDNKKYMVVTNGNRLSCVLID